MYLVKQEIYNHKIRGGKWYLEKVGLGKVWQDLEILIVFFS